MNSRVKVRHRRKHINAKTIIALTTLRVIFTRIKLKIKFSVNNWLLYDTIARIIRIYHFCLQYRVQLLSPQYGDWEKVGSEIFFKKAANSENFFFALANQKYNCITAIKSVLLYIKHIDAADLHPVKCEKMFIPLLIAHLKPSDSDLALRWLEVGSFFFLSNDIVTVSGSVPSTRHVIRKEGTDPSRWSATKRLHGLSVRGRALIGYIAN